ncbi:MULTISPECIES: response regulator [unclassified Moorena]|uniref:hybrid sensor histidine kinase/response regulator n=1 Tax=unclassified Moorena TaxID=2683338 RepID=UPI0013BA1C7E|nr:MULTISPECIES: response regulator [unclassified Moorena]NEP33651.1 hybrid sensor histidine kinase/response regulator [Moorena sp. SIO3B2]NEQ08910.1 hybrid sensor histidine kinase/response regulator [Moorena sp. SIO4E2]NER86969.1 hybrid sensor histidine kinase/response regulator [Moorena sp. SIO3A2]NET67391.1 hybrid sensor histidine kinase/response regulator [Moorena sp. SIO1G6]
MSQILVIEDEEDIRSIVVEILRAENFDVIQAENGEIGVELAKKESPDLIICDIKMPKLDGYGVMIQLQEIPSTQTITLIFITAKSTKSDLRMGMELGADDYLTKPFTRDELLGAVTTRIAKQMAFEQESQKQVDELRDCITHALPHELRTPLNGILNLAQFLIEDYDTIDRDEAMDMLQQICVSGERLYRLTHNFLLYAELARIEQQPKQARKLINYGEQSFTRTIIQDLAMQKFKKVNRKDDLHLELQEAVVKISQSKFTKIVEEIIDNALKFSDLGKPIQIQSYFQDNHLNLLVIDQGRGMTPTQIAKLGAYMQFDRKLYEQQGSGLGLIIAKLLTELHGGELNISSFPVKQTIVHIMLPGKLSI